LLLLLQQFLLISLQSHLRRLLQSLRRLRFLKLFLSHNLLQIPFQRLLLSLSQRLNLSRSQPQNPSLLLSQLQNLFLSRL
jgi:hypothetical protein